MSTRKTAAPAPRRDLTIGALAKRARVAPSVLRYYEKEGLLRPGLRSAAGYRLYGPEAERTLLFINRAKRLGFSLDDIRQFLAAGQPAAEPVGRKKTGQPLDVAAIDACPRAPCQKSRAAAGSAR